MKITLNLASRPYADQGPALKRLRIGMAVLAVILILLGFGIQHFHQSALKMAAQEEALDISVARIRQEQQGYQTQMEEPANARVLTQAGFLNNLFDEKSFSWTAAMEDLEQVLPAGVQVTAIEPVRAKDGRLTLKLRVSGLRERAVQMVRDMERSRRFSSPRISGESTEASTGQGNLQQVRDAGLVTFDVLAEYNPATLEERRVELATHKPVHTVTTPLPQRPVGAGSGVRPQYIPPNPQPRVRPNAGMRVRPQPLNAPVDPGPEPSGFDPNGLKNHQRNNLPPPDAVPNPNQGGQR